MRTGLKLLIVLASAGLLVHKLKFSPFPVVSHQASVGPVAAEVMGTGTLEARVKTAISPRIQERLAEVLVDQGDSVGEGQLLARLDDGELKRQVEVAEATLASAKATAERVRVDEARAQAVEHQARQDHERISDLVRTKVSSKADFDKAVEQLSVAEADLKRAQAAITEAESQVLNGPRPLVDLRAFRRHHLGFVFQKANLIPFLSAVQNVQVALEINGVPARQARRHALELLDYLGVADRAGHLPDALSGGQQQRVSVARALANEPSLILADEPTAALDSHRGRHVMELFSKVAHERGAGVIVVTHDQRSLDVFDRTYEMEDGRLIDGRLVAGMHRR